jgi:hypothetical protein
MADPDPQEALGGSAVTAYVTSRLDEMPIRYPVRVEIVSPEPFHEREGYTIATAIEEVLVDAGFLADERLIDMERHGSGRG